MSEMTLKKHLCLYPQKNHYFRIWQDDLDGHLARCQAYWPEIYSNSHGEKREDQIP